MHAASLSPHDHDSPARPCPGCRTELPASALFCVECGLCMLDVTGSGTVIVRSPYADVEDRHRLDRSSKPEGRVVVDIDIDIDDLVGRLTDEDDDGSRTQPRARVGEIEASARPQTVVTHGPVPPRVHWDAPPKGDTQVVRKRALARHRVVTS